MDGVSKTLYIPLYGKAYVSSSGVILRDRKAEEIWSKAGFPLKGKSASKWLAYFMAMRAAVYDRWVEQQLECRGDAAVVHIGCGLDSRALRVGTEGRRWYDVDFPEVIAERERYYQQTEHYHMLGLDMRAHGWQEQIPGGCPGIVVLEGVSMYFRPRELETLLTALAGHFTDLSLLMDCYTRRGAKASRYKNPINDVGVTQVYGYDEPEALAVGGLQFLRERDMTPPEYIRQLPGMEQTAFRRLFAGGFAKSIYRMYEYGKT